MSSAVLRISGCASLCARRFQKLSHSVAVTITVCHMNGSSSRLATCLWTLSHSSGRSLLRFAASISSTASSRRLALGDIRRRDQRQHAAHGVVAAAEPLLGGLRQRLALERRSRLHPRLVGAELHRDVGILEHSAQLLPDRDRPRARRVAREHPVGVELGEDESREGGLEGGQAMTGGRDRIGEDFRFEGHRLGRSPICHRGRTEKPGPARPKRAENRIAASSRDRTPSGDPPAPGRGTPGARRCSRG